MNKWRDNITWKDMQRTGGNKLLMAFLEFIIRNTLFKN